VTADTIASDLVALASLTSRGEMTLLLIWPVTANGVAFSRGLGSLGRAETPWASRKGKGPAAGRAGPFPHLAAPR
jgi:hypothetical protein